MLITSYLRLGNLLLLKLHLAILHVCSSKKKKWISTPRNHVVSPVNCTQQAHVHQFVFHSQVLICGDRNLPASVRLICQTVKMIKRACYLHHILTPAALKRKKNSFIGAAETHHLKFTSLTGRCDIPPPLLGCRTSPYLSGGLDQRCGAHAAAAGAGALGPLQQDPRSGHVTPRQAQSHLHLPAAASRHVVGYLRSHSPLCFSHHCFSPCEIITASLYPV